jgi:hypothetical protein
MEPAAEKKLIKFHPMSGNLFFMINNRKVRKGEETEVTIGVDTPANVGDVLDIERFQFEVVSESERRGVINLPQKTFQRLTCKRLNEDIK